MTRTIVAAVSVALAVATPTQLGAQSPSFQDSVRSAVSEQARAAKARAGAATAVESAKAAAARGEIRAGSAAPTADGDVASVAAVAVAVIALILLWIALGRAGARAWLARRHGAQLLLAWGALLLYTVASCASAAVSIFTPNAHAVSTLALDTLWLALAIVTWRWGSARGGASRTH